MRMKNKSCELDQIDTSTLKDILAICLPTIIQIVHMSLTKEDFNKNWKNSHSKTSSLKTCTRTYTKKLQTCLKLLLSLKTGRVVHVVTVTGLLHARNFIPDFQSAYRKNYSAETNLIKMTNDILWGSENQNITSIVILDLLAAFDTVDHEVLLTILWDHFGFQGTTLKWFENYLHSRYFKVATEDKYSKPKELTFSVPQGSCRSASLFTCYCSLIEDQINNSITLNGFADDHSILKNFKAGNKDQQQQTKTYLWEAFKQIKCCKDTMHLKLNSDKTDYILFGSQAQLKNISPEAFNAHGDLIEISKVVRYLGGCFDQQLNFKQHIKEKVKKQWPI